MKWIYGAIVLLALLLSAFYFFEPKPTLGLEVVGERALSLLPMWPQEATILAVGDMQFDRKIRLISEVQGGDYIFSCIDELLRLPDFVIGNLEGPITDHPSVSVGSVPGSPDNFVFTFPTTTAALLAKHNFGAVTVGNNHIYNFGSTGFASTKYLLTEAQVGFFGGVKGDESIYRRDQDGVPLSFVGYNEFGGSSAKDVAKIIAAEHAEGRIVIVFAHWGDEYVDSSERLRPFATLFAQSGASVVLGAHPHVVGAHEYIGNTLVYYSLGNFIFDQYFSKEVMQGLALMLHISKEGKVTVDEYPTVVSRDGRVCTQ